MRRHFNLIGCYALIAATLCSCQKTAPSDPTVTESKSHLRSALVALDQGDDRTAEHELKASLSSDPFNSRARTTLASLYAKQAGISLNDWLDPFWEAGRRLGSSLRNYQSSTDIIDEVTHEVRSVSDQFKTNLSDEERQTRDRIENLLKSGGRFTLGMSVALDIFNSIPYLTDAQLVQLDKAIQTLRESGVAPRDRPEEERVYMSILSFVRLVNDTKRLLGDQNTYSISYERERLCSLDADVLKARLDQIRRSLTHLEEGLTVSPSDPVTTQREARIKMQGFVTKFLESTIWDHLDNLFDSATPEGAAASQLSRHFCRNYGTADLRPTSLRAAQSDANSLRGSLGRIALPQAGQESKTDTSDSSQDQPDPAAALQ